VVRLMFVGDSITAGGTGDRTWRFQLWRHLMACGVADVAFVGPSRGTREARHAVRTTDADASGESRFDANHLALWGQPFTAIMEDIGTFVDDYQPDIVLTLLGINDFIWQGETAFQVEQDVRIYVAEARRHRFGVGFVFGHVLPNAGSAQDEDLAVRIADFNARLDALSVELSLPSSPVAVAATDESFEHALHTVDGIHPNRLGEVRIAAAFADALASVFDIGSPFPRSRTLGDPPARGDGRRAPGHL
jgi:hypothetical protein